MDIVVVSDKLSASYESVRNYLQDRVGLSVGLAAAGTTVAALGAYYYLRQKSQPAQPLHHDLKQQSVEVEAGVRASTLTEDGRLVEYLYDDSRTLYEAFLRGVRMSGNRPYLGRRSGNQDYEWITYQQAYDRAQHVGSALVEKGLKSSTDFIGIFSQNRPEWLITEHACNMYSLVSVPLYDTLGRDACTYIINQTGIRIVICDKADKAMTLLKNTDEMPSLKFIVIMDDVTEELTKEARDRQVELLRFKDLEESGKRCKKEHVPPKPDDLCTICYTSGTTGNPKGVMLSHKNIISNIAAVTMASQMYLDVNDTHISYLPLAHMFDRAVSVAVYQSGGRIGYFRGDVKLLTEDLMTLKPTMFPTVPRLLNRIYDKVLAGVSNSWLKSTLFHLALEKKEALLKKGIFSNSTIWDRLVFHKIQKLLGGKVKYMISGAAPVSPTVLDFAKCSMGCFVQEGYGQTEATAGVTFTFADETEAGHVGAPLPCNYVKLVDVPEMDYYAKDNKGEVCVKGNNVMLGYYKDEAKTSEAIDEDGWLHTGDIGVWRPNGTLKIVDRKKHIFKLAQGEYIAPEKIENVYIQSELVSQAFVDGNSLQPFTVAVIVPDMEVLPKWAESKGLTDNTDELCNNPVLKKAIFDDIIRIGKGAGLKSFEQVKDIFIHNEMFTTENGLLTPTFKAKRPVLKRRFEKQFDTMYSNMQK